MAERVAQRAVALAPGLVLDLQHRLGAGRHRAGDGGVDVRHLQVDRHRRSPEPGRPDHAEVRELVADHHRRAVDPQAGVDDLAVRRLQARQLLRPECALVEADRLGRSAAYQVRRDAVDLARARDRFRSTCANSSSLESLRVRMSEAERRRRVDSCWMRAISAVAGRMHGDRRQRSRHGSAPVRRAPCRTDLAGAPCRISVAAAVRGRVGDPAEPPRGGFLRARAGRARPRRPGAPPPRRGGRRLRGRGRADGATPGGEYSDTLEIYPDLALARADADEAGIARFELQPTLGPTRQRVSAAIRRCSAPRTGCGERCSGGPSFPTSRRRASRTC